MFNVYFSYLMNIIIQMGASSSDVNFLTLLEKIVQMLTNIAILIGGVYGINYIANLRKKQVDAAFGYFCILKVYIVKLKLDFEEYKNEIMDRLLPFNEREKIDSAREGPAKNAIEDISSTANEVLLFLKNSNNQMPCSIGWSYRYNTFLEFLEECKKIKNENYYKWTDHKNDEYNNFYNKHFENLENILEDITQFQNDLEKKIFKKPWYKINIFSRFRNI